MPCTDQFHNETNPFRKYVTFIFRRIFANHFFFEKKNKKMLENRDYRNDTFVDFSFVFGKYRLAKSTAKIHHLISHDRISTKKTIAPFNKFKYTRLKKIL